MMNKSTMKMFGLSVIMAVILSSCGGVAMLGQKTAPNLLQGDASASNAGPVAQATVTPIDALPGADSSGLLLAYENTLSQIYDQVNSSVVNIRVVQQVDTASSTGTLPLFPFFNLPGVPNTPNTPQQNTPQYSQSLGSGFVWDKQGDIVTNNHVVDGADKIEVTFSDGSVAQADLVGADPDSDLAVIHVSVAADRLNPIAVGESEQARVGQLAIAIGNPFGLQGSMTVGIVSALGRTLPAGDTTYSGTSYSIPDIIQTDAPINPGNSGGVLVDDTGRLIGVTAAIESPVGANAGIGFAIPSAIVRRVVPALIATGSYEHPYLGISGIRLSSEIAQAMNLPSDQQGALVEEVVPGGPADQAGIVGSDRQFSLDGTDINIGGDVIVAIDGQKVSKMDDLIAYLNDHTEVGQKITLSVLRNGNSRDIEITLQPRPDHATATAAQAQSGSQAWLGIKGFSMDQDLAQAMNLDPQTQGVLIEQIEVGSPADEAGLQGSYKPAQIAGQTVLVGGDIITAIDGNPIQSVEDLQAFLSSAKPDQNVTLSVIRGTREIKVDVQLKALTMP